MPTVKPVVLGGKSASQARTEKKNGRANGGARRINTIAILPSGKGRGILES